jgi:hypothetical protein
MKRLYRWGMIWLSLLVGDMVGAQGGRAGISPNLSRLIGVFRNSEVNQNLPQQTLYLF